ncbi:RagB/SusD family nutrient uptake outer membrane protein [Cellulophaga sp. HaHa_2_95]|uniref:RagB/SusD family nutrient uptake outer membrane protein n=1 Tax=unclassified Cellulophaga TaxID=2634405 RepID=UPI001C4E7A75|nr:RagB/SusD family nutrient uptake outer membrane protein [Cellulophaga sp. HaHa_2_95]QXP55731.1 RagB/SusD family nutrient uptake outer membrane protein [Cellulophaga sp. HaHa_2_95]
MRKIIFNRIVVALLCVLCGTACSDDFLAETNPNELSTGSFWKNNVDLNTGLTSVYNGFKNTSIFNVVSENHRADMTWPGFGRPNTQNAFYLQTFNDAENDIRNKWAALYVVIFRANQVIENGNRLKETYTDQDKIDFATEIIAQARFFRGISYTYLYNMFNQGSVPIFDFVPESEDEFYQPVSSASDVKAFYIADLEFAYENLPPVWDGNVNLGRVTSAAAAAELGRSYLYEEEYTQAAVYFNDIITNPEYGRSLVENIDDNFSEAGEFNSESILEVSYSVNFKAELNPFDSQNVSNTLGRSFSPGNLGGYRSGVPSCWLQMAYKNEAMDLSDPRNFVPCEDGSEGCDPVTLTRPRSYSLRTSYSLALVDDVDTPFYGGFLPGQVTPFNNKECAYFRKYSNWATVNSENDIVPNTRSGINIRLVRLADVYLMLAECLIKGGTDEGGLNDALALVNEVRHRSALQLIGLNGTGSYPGADHDNVAYSAQELMEHLMYVERPLELAEEGHAIRFLDLRRWGVLKQRFQDLSTKKYWGDNYVTTDTDGKVVTRWGALLIEGENPTAGGFTYVDYAQAAVNYSENLHGYYPIPNSEVTANPNLNN